MNFPRRFLVWLALASLLAKVPVCAGRQAKIPKVTPPVQNYAVLDITGAGINSVGDVALNDANQAAFGTYTQSGCTTYAFKNGTTTHVQDMAYLVTTTTADTTTTESRTLVGTTNVIDSQGNIYGTLYRVTTTTAPVYQHDETDAFMICRDGQPSEFSSPPFPSAITNSHGMTVAGEGRFGGITSGLVDPSDPYSDSSSGVLFSNGTVLFDPDEKVKSVAGDSRVIGTLFVPYLINNTGSAIGEINNSGGWALWDGSTFTDITAPGVNDLNDQNQYIARPDEGEFWEKGHATVLRDTLPPLIQYQYRNIQPFSLSNQVKVSPPPQKPAPDSDATVHLLARADGFDVGNYGTMLYTRNNQGKWTFANLALPAGTTIDDFVTINSSGVIAAIGNGGHALLLLPVNYAEVSPASGFDGLTQPPWLMVPQSGVNSALAYTPASANLPVSFAVKPGSAVDSVLPATTKVSPQTITVHSETPGDDHLVGLGVGNLTAKGSELQVSVKPRKTVKVAIHQIQQYDDKTLGPAPNAPTAAQAQAYLNQVYGPQTNTYFTVTRTDYLLDYDTGGGPNGAPDGKLNFRSNQPFTSEQRVLEDYAKDSSADYNVYFVHDYLGDGPDSVGHAVTRLDAAYILDYSERTSVVTVLAHEFGHLLGIEYHADLAVSFNPGYLPGTDPTIRLMYSGILSSPHPDPKVLIKAEWDTISSSKPNTK